MDWLTAPFQYPFMQQALLAAVLVGLTCAVVGVYVVLRRMAFIGDALSHTVLPGLVVAYLNGWSLYGGAVAAGVVTALAIGWISRRGAVREDTAIGIIFTGMFALGILMMSSARSFRDLSHILFGNILGITGEQLALISGVAGLILVLVLLLHKELELTSYDPQYASSIGLSPNMMRYLLLVLLALTVVTAIQAVGVVLTSALLVTPAAAASLLTSRLPRMMALAALFAIGSAIVGLYVSFYWNLASGAAIVLAATGCFILASAIRALRMRLA